MKQLTQEQFDKFYKKILISTFVYVLLNIFFGLMIWFIVFFYDYASSTWYTAIGLTWAITFIPCYWIYATLAKLRKPLYYFSNMIQKQVRGITVKNYGQGKFGFYLLISMPLVNALVFIDALWTIRKMRKQKTLILPDFTIRIKKFADSLTNSFSFEEGEALM